MRRECPLQSVDMLVSRPQRRDTHSQVSCLKMAARIGRLDLLDAAAPVTQSDMPSSSSVPGRCPLCTPTRYLVGASRGRIPLDVWRRSPISPSKSFRAFLACQEADGAPGYEGLRSCPAVSQRTYSGPHPSPDRLPQFLVPSPTPTMPRRQPCSPPCPPGSISCDDPVADTAEHDDDEDGTSQR
jgi:hypothetical protein